jgi:hypothetical protein
MRLNYAAPFTFVVAMAAQRHPARWGILENGYASDNSGALNAHPQKDAVASAKMSGTNPSPSTSNQEPCAVISSSMAVLEPTARAVIPADLGLACLKSVPVDTEGDLQLIEEFKLYMQWHSSLAYLKEPPLGYTEPPVDIMAGLDDISMGLAAGNYTSEYG